MGSSRWARHFRVVPSERARNVTYYNTLWLDNNNNNNNNIYLRPFVFVFRCLAAKTFCSSNNAIFRSTTKLSLVRVRVMHAGTYYIQHLMVLLSGNHNNKLRMTTLCYAIQCMNEWWPLIDRDLDLLCFGSEKKKDGKASQSKATTTKRNTTKKNMNHVKKNRPPKTNASTHKK